MQGVTLMSRLHPKADSLSNWSYGQYLKVPDFDFKLPDVGAAAKYMKDARIDEHPFFEKARSNPEYLHIWAEQEMITSSCFSQVITEWMAQIDNCHVRSLVLPVFAGEHGKMFRARGRLEATQSHPYLAEKLCRSLKRNIETLRALPPTQQFIDDMEESATTAMGGAGFLGIGNERMLIDEYGAVREAFRSTIPTADFQEFLDRNIAEDTVHHDLIERAARGLISLAPKATREELAREFLFNAIKGVDARMHYYDDLVTLLESR